MSSTARPFKGGILQDQSAIAKPSFEGAILLLISEPVVRLIIRELLDRAGYFVIATGDVGAAVDRIHESKVDLLIVSPYVDSITGYAAAKYLRTQCPGLRVLVVAGLLADDRLQNRAELERFDIFPEPFTASQLLKKVAAIIYAPLPGAFSRTRRNSSAGTYFSVIATSSAEP
jgi:DNA-binding NtrC family response regulator